MDLDLIHHPYVLVGLDVFCSALLVFLAVHIASRRFRSYLLRSGPSLSAGTDPDPELLGRGQREALETERAAGGSDVEKIARQAQKLRRKGLSVEEISRKLETATSEIEMLLALKQDRKDRQGRQASLRSLLRYKVRPSLEPGR